MNKNLPEISLLREYLHYDPESGDLTWIKPRQRVKVGQKVSGYDNGYSRVRFQGRLLGAHRVAFALYHGRWPTAEIDHIDGNRGNNRISNLREATHAENMRNRKIHSTNVSGVPGVSWHKAARKWQVHIGATKDSRYLGLFENLADAADARRQAEQTYFGEFTINQYYAPTAEAVA
jgi:hypothetical protein